MKNLILISFILSLGLFSCSDSYKYWDISKFNVDENLIADSTEVIFLYSSRGPGLKYKNIANKDGEYDHATLLTDDYYIHLLARVKETNDTINILTPGYNWFKPEDMGKTYVFLSRSNPKTKYMMKDLNKLSKINSIDDLRDIERTKVTRDSKYDFIADNDFPSTIGSVARKEE